MLRIAWIVPGFSSNMEDWCIPALLDLARAVARRCELRIVAMRYPYRRDSYSIGGAKVFSIGGAHRGARYTPGVWRDTAQAIRSTSCDLVHAFWGYEPGLIAAWFAHRMPVIISLAGGELVSMPEIEYGLMRHMRTRMLIRWALRKALVVTAGSPDLVTYARSLLSLPALRHMPLGVDLGRWNYLPREDGSPTILNVGSLERVKGQDILIRALPDVLREIPSARCLIVGGGQELHRLEALARKLGLSAKVEFAGGIPHEEMSRIYASARLFVQASWHEAQGMALLEAAACGLPLAGTSVGAITNFIPEGAVGAPAGDPVKLAAAVLQILSGPQDALELSRKARMKVEESYSLEVVADRFLQLYRSVV